MCGCRGNKVANRTAAALRASRAVVTRTQATAPAVAQALAAAPPHPIPQNAHLDQRRLRIEKLRRDRARMRINQ